MSRLIERDQHPGNILDVVEELQRRLDRMEKYPPGQTSPNQNAFSLPVGIGQIFKNAIDYSAISTVTGWSSLTQNVLLFQQLGPVMFVSFYLLGTSNSGYAYVTLPRAANNRIHFVSRIKAQDAGAYADDGYAEIAGKDNALVWYLRSLGSGGWTASGIKSVEGQIFYFIDNSG